LSKINKHINFKEKGGEIDMATITGKIMHNRYCVEPLFVASANFVVSMYPENRLNYIGRSIY